MSSGNKQKDVVKDTPNILSPSQSDIQAVHLFFCGNPATERPKQYNSRRYCPLRHRGVVRVTIITATVFLVNSYLLNLGVCHSKEVTVQRVCSCRHCERSEAYRLGSGDPVRVRSYAAVVIASEAKQSSIANRINKDFIFVE
jgi:hypothetical protein